MDLARLDLSLDWRVVTAGVLICGVTLAIAALLPIVRFTRADIAGDLTAASSTASVSSLRLRQTLLGLHVAATLVVLVAAGLFVRAIILGFRGGPGFDVDRTAYMQAQVVPGFVSAARRAVARPRTRIPGARFIHGSAACRGRVLDWPFARWPDLAR